MKIAAIIFILAFVGAAPTTNPAGRRDVGVDEFEKLWKEKKGLVLDVRTAKEFEAGHIPGAVNIDVKSADFDKKLAELDKDKTYLVHCASGVRSVQACEKMKRLDFKQLINLQGGIKAWEKAGKPVEKPVEK
jgi:rhodanese-related sulfurtransferase